MQVSEGVVDDQVWGGVSSCNLCLLGVNSGVSLPRGLVSLAPLLIRRIDDVVFLVDVVPRLATPNFFMQRSSLLQLLFFANLTCQRLVKVPWGLLIWWLLGLT